MSKPERERVTWKGDEEDEVTIRHEREKQYQLAEKQRREAAQPKPQAKDTRKE